MRAVGKMRNASPELRFSAPLGQESEVEVALV